MTIYKLDAEVPIKFNVRKFTGSEGRKGSNLLELQYHPAINDEHSWVLVPFSPRFAPLALWLVEHGVGVVSEDAGVSGEINFYEELEPAPPANVRVASLRSVQLSVYHKSNFSTELMVYSPLPYGLGWIEDEPPVRGLEWVSHRRVEGIDLIYELRGGDGNVETVQISTDCFLFEHDNAEYSVIRARQKEADVTMMADSALFESVVRIFVRIQTGIDGFDAESFKDTDCWADLREAQVLIAAALADKKERDALKIAARYFDISDRGITKYLPETWS